MLNFISELIAVLLACLLLTWLKQVCQHVMVYSLCCPGFQSICLCCMTLTYSWAGQLHRGLDKDVPGGFTCI